MNHNLSQKSYSSLESYVNVFGYTDVRFQDPLECYAVRNPELLNHPRISWGFWASMQPKHTNNMLTRTPTLSVLN